MDMREARSESGAFGCDAPLGTTQQSPAPGFDAVSQHDVVAVVVAEPLSAKIRDRQHGDQVFNTSTQQHLEPKNEDSSFAQTYSSKDIDSWRRSVALRNSTTWTAGVASTTHHEPLSPQHTNATYGIDIEKQSLRASSRSSQQTTPTGLVERGGAVYISYRVPLVDGCDAEDHTPWILVYPFWVESVRSPVANTHSPALPLLPLLTANHLHRPVHHPNPLLHPSPLSPIPLHTPQTPPPTNRRLPPPTPRLPTLLPVPRWLPFGFRP